MALLSHSDLSRIYDRDAVAPLINWPEPFWLFVRELVDAGLQKAPICRWKPKTSFDYRQKRVSIALTPPMSAFMRPFDSVEKPEALTYDVRVVDFEFQLRRMKVEEQSSTYATTDMVGFEMLTEDGGLVKLTDDERRNYDALCAAWRRKRQDRMVEPTSVLKARPEPWHQDW